MSISLTTKKAFISFLFLFIFFVFAFLKPTLVSADGMIINWDPYEARWDYTNESNQQAYINYENGTERLIISIGVENTRNQKTAWIFPLPSDPDSIDLDIVADLPNFEGEDISILAEKNLKDSRKILFSTQLYPLIFSFDPYSGISTMAPSEGIMLGGLEGLGTKKDVAVHKQLEKEGITSQVITSKTGLGVYDYLRSKGLKIENGSIPVLNSYIGRDYSFVVSWISSGTTRDQRGVFVKFPTEKIYYPLLPTSIYGSTRIPTTIRIAGYRSPEIYGGIKSHTDVSYYMQKNLFVINDEMNLLLNSLDSGNKQVIRDFKYTKIDINAPSVTFTDDLWIKPNTPLKTRVAHFFAARYYFAFSTIALLLFTSFVTGVISGWAVYKELRSFKNLIDHGTLGLTNCFSIIALLTATLLLKRERSIRFVFNYSISFLIITWLTIKLITIWL